MVLLLSTGKIQFRDDILQSTHHFLGDLLTKALYFVHDHLFSITDVCVPLLQQVSSLLYLILFVLYTHQQLLQNLFLLVRSLVHKQILVFLVLEKLAVATGHFVTSFTKQLQWLMLVQFAVHGLFTVDILVAYRLLLGHNCMVLGHTHPLVGLHTLSTEPLAAVTTVRRSWVTFLTCCACVANIFLFFGADFAVQIEFVVDDCSSREFHRTSWTFESIVFILDFIQAPFAKLM